MGYGSPCSIISEQTFRKIKDGRTTVEKTLTKLWIWSKKTLHILGKTMVGDMFKRRAARLPIMVVAKQGSSLIGRNWYRHLDIQLHGIRSISTPGKELLVPFSEVFGSDLPGYKEVPIHIELKDVQPKFANSTPVPFALRKDVVKELGCREQKGHT